MTPPTTPADHLHRPPTEDRPDPAWTDGGAARPPAVDGAEGQIDWERPPPRGPLLRWRAAGAGLLLVAVAVLAWWAVVWLTSPAAPPSVSGGTPGATAAAETASSPAPAVGTGAPTAGRAPGSGPSATPPGASASPPGADDADARVRVHVVGAVEHPAVVELPADARVADAVAAAGGARRDAHTDRINLAAPVQDGQQITVPDADTPVSATPDSPVGAAATPSAGSDAADAAGSGRVDLNTADAAMLETLPGVGPATAEKIIGHRDSVGPFTGLQDLDAVPGIGPAALERLKDSVTW